MKIKKRTIYLIAGILLVIALWYLFFSTPEYENKIIPKPALGNPNAAIKIVEYSDFQCPFCKEAHGVVKQILAEYKDDISFEFKQFPLTTIHPMSFKAAEASECANDQGKFWEYSDLLFANQEYFSLRKFKELATELALDAKLFNACLDSGAKKQIVEMDQRAGLAMGVQSTPSFFINGQKLENWRYDALKQKIDEIKNKS